MNVPLQSVCPGADIQHSQLPTAPLVVGIVLRTLASNGVSSPRARRLRGPPGSRPLTRGNSQVVMSRVAKFAQAAARNTTTYTAWMANPR